MTAYLACEICLTRPATQMDGYYDRVLCGTCGCECGSCRYCCEARLSYIPADWEESHPNPITVEAQ